MSQQRTKEQERAARAWDCVIQVKGKSYAKEYGQLAKSSPMSIQLNGFGQTLAFLLAKGSKEGKPKDNGNNAHWKLQEHLSDWLMKQLKITHHQGLMGWIMDEKTSGQQYRRATAEAMAFLQWLKRFAEAQLDEEK